MSKGLRGFVDDAHTRTGPLAVEKSGDFPTARPFAHKLHRALFGSEKIPEGRNQSCHRSTRPQQARLHLSSRISCPNNRGHLSADPTAVASQITRLKAQSGMAEVVMVDDRGRIKAKGKAALSAQGFRYITALTNAQVRTLLKQGVLQTDLFYSAFLSPLTRYRAPRRLPASCACRLPEGDRRCCLLFRRIAMQFFTKFM